MGESEPPATAEPSPKSRRYPKEFQQDAVFPASSPPNGRNYNSQTAYFVLSVAGGLRVTADEGPEILPIKGRMFVVGRRDARFKID